MPNSDSENDKKKVGVWKCSKVFPVSMGKKSKVNVDFKRTDIIIHPFGFINEQPRAGKEVVLQSYL